MVELKTAYEQITKFLPSHDREMVDRCKYYDLLNYDLLSMGRMSRIRLINFLLLGGDYFYRQSGFDALFEAHF